MNIYYIAGFPVSDELYHHGILGQKWGIRRYQNPDGTLTAEGKARYGSEGLGRENPHSLLRRIVTGDHPFLGTQRLRSKREERLKRKVEKIREAKTIVDQQKSESSIRDRMKASKKLGDVVSKYEAQKKKNIDIDRYISNTSTGKLWAQKFILGPFADSYRASRARGANRGRSFVDSIMPRFNLHPLNSESITAKIADKKKYGNLAHGE